MNDEIIGIDKPAGSRRWRWWEVVGAVLIAVGLVAWIADKAVTTEAEKAAEALDSFFQALGDRDGDRACALITNESRSEVLAVDRTINGEERDCESALIGQIDQLEALGGPALDDLKELDRDRIEDELDVNGDRASLSGEVGLANQSLSLVKVSGEWQLDLTTAEASATRTTDSDASTEEIMNAADKICVAAFTRSGVELARLVGALEAGQVADAEDHAKAWADSERRLASELNRLMPVGGLSKLNELVAAVQDEVRAISRMADRPEILLRRPALILGPVRRVATVAAENGFAQFGCAAPPGNGAPE